MPDEKNKETTEPWLDLHTHTTFSDGDLTPEEMARLAIGRGITHLAITDHLFTHIAPVHVVGLDSNSAPGLGEEMLKEVEGDAVSDRSFTEYMDEIARVKADAAKEGLHVLAGGELDFIAADDKVRHMADALNRLDFILVENVHGGNWEKFRSFLKIIDVPVGLAHVEISSAFPEVLPRMLASAVGRTDVFVELNVASLWRVESFQESVGHFRELAKRGQRFSFGTDLHGRMPIRSALNAGWEFVVSNGLEPNLEWIRELAVEKGHEAEDPNLAGMVDAENENVGEGGRQS
ncbi:MAG: PHP domain-containing protein [Planctomycetota bacterium]|jgi:histidinol phosphatase-like PHP family hydrolase